MAVKDYYDEIAESYDSLRYGTSYQRRVAEFELRFIQTYVKDGRCLEVGAGTGRVTKFLLNQVTQLIAVDISASMLERLTANLAEFTNLTTQVLDIHELSSLDGYGAFNSVVCLRVLPHLENPIDALKQLRGAVLGDGVVIIDLWNAWGYQSILQRLRLKSPAVYTHYDTVTDMRAAIDAAGLTIVDQRGFGFPPLRVCLPLEARPLLGLGRLAQRILWVCRPNKEERPV